MIIECGHCGAPLDVKANDRVVKCNYCNQSNQVKSTRTVATATPAGWNPPQQWTPPSHAAANSAQVLTYHRTRSSSGALVAFAVLGVLGVGIAVAASVFSGVVSATQQTQQAQKSVDDAMAQANDALERAMAQASAAQQEIDRGLGKVPRAAGSNAELSLLTGAGVQQTLNAYKQAIGVRQLNVMQLTFHETHSSLEVQSPKNPNHVDGYRYMRGVVTGPEPVRLVGREKNNLQAQLFDPEKIALKDIDELRTKAIGELAYEQAKITHVIVDKRGGKTTIRVYGSNDRESGYVRFSDVGRVVRTYR